MTAPIVTALTIAQLPSFVGPLSGNEVVAISVGGVTYSATANQITAGITGTVTVTGSPAAGNLTQFSGGTTITNANLSGDVNTSGSTVTTLASIIAAGTTGSAAASTVVTNDVKGRITAITTTPIQIAESQVANLVSDLAGKQASGSYITALTGDGTASGPGSATLTLTTVNTNTGSFGSTTAIPSFTVNGKGLITAASTNVVIAPAGTLSGTTLASNVVSSSLTSLGTQAQALNMGSRQINALTDPSAAQDAATKNYVDTVAQGLSAKASAVLATTTALPTNVYNNGASGVGATLTGVATGVLTIDGGAVAVGNRLVIKNEAAPANNGLYSCTTAGALGAAYVLTRTTDANTSAELDGAFVFVESGTVNGSTGWVIANSGTITIGMTAINWTQFSGAGTYTAGTGLTLTGSQFSVNASQTQITAVGTITAGTWSAAFGAVSGANLTSLTAANISAGTAGINVSGSAATLTTPRAIGIGGSTGLTATGVNFDGSTAISPALAGTLAVANGGTGDTGTAWTAYTPTLTSQGGSFTTASATGRYKTLGKTCFIEMVITITTVGSGGGAIVATLPGGITAQSSAVLAGRENALTGDMVQGLILASSTSITQILNYNNTSPVGAGASVILSGVFETQ